MAFDIGHVTSLRDKLKALWDEYDVANRELIGSDRLWITKPARHRELHAKTTALSHSIHRVERELSEYVTKVERMERK